MKETIFNIGGRVGPDVLSLHDSAGTRNWVNVLEISASSVMKDCPGLPGNPHQCHDFGILPHLPIKRLKVRGAKWGQLLWGESLFNMFISKELRSKLEQFGVPESAFRSLNHIQGGKREQQVIDNYEWLVLPVVDCFDRERSGFVETVKCPLCGRIEATKKGDGLFFRESRISSPLFRIAEYPFHVFAVAGMAELFIQNQWSPLIVMDSGKLTFSGF